MKNEKTLGKSIEMKVIENNDNDQNNSDKTNEKNKSNDENNEIKNKLIIDAIKTEDYSFKWLCFRPHISYVFFNWKFTFVVLCVSCFFENILVSGVATVILSTIEKEFYLTSTKSGLFLGVYELAACFASPVYGYFATKCNKMKILSFSFFLVTFGAYLIGIIIFFKPPSFQFNNNSFNNETMLTASRVCNSSTNTSAVNNSDSDISDSGFEAMLYIGHIIIGFNFYHYFRIKKN